MHSGRLWGAKKPPRDRSWGVRAGPGAPGNQPKASPGRSWDAPGRLRSGPRARLVHRALSNTLAERFFIVAVSSRTSSDVRFTSVFMVFCCHQTKYAQHARAQQKRSKIEASQKSSPGASGRPKIEPERFISRDKTRKSRAKLCDFLKSGRERARRSDQERRFGRPRAPRPRGTWMMVRQER